MPHGVSGPAARGDLAALKRHEAALEGEASALYLVLSAQLVELLRVEIERPRRAGERASDATGCYPGHDSRDMYEGACSMKTCPRGHG